jgi:hypothetical protein
MKIIKEGATEIYDFTCEEIKERICPICKTIYEYTNDEIKQSVIEVFDTKISYLYLICPFCSNEEILNSCFCGNY